MFGAVPPSVRQARKGWPLRDGTREATERREGSPTEKKTAAGSRPQGESPGGSYTAAAVLHRGEEAPGPGEKIDKARDPRPAPGGSTQGFFIPADGGGRG